MVGNMYYQQHGMSNLPISTTHFRCYKLAWSMAENNLSKRYVNENIHNRRCGSIPLCRSQQKINYRAYKGFVYIFVVSTTRLRGEKMNHWVNTQQRENDNHWILWRVVHYVWQYLRSVLFFRVRISEDHPLMILEYIQNKVLWIYVSRWREQREISKHV